MTYRTADTLLTIALVISVIAFILGIGIRLDQVAKQRTQEACDKAHLSVSGELERACGEAQDKWHTEYLCTSQKADAFCWVEVK